MPNTLPSMAQMGSFPCPLAPEDKASRKISDRAGSLDYYKALGAATDLPLMVQSHGDMSVDSIVALYQQVPTLKGVKDETGNPLPRLPEFRKRTITSSWSWLQTAQSKCLMECDWVLMVMCPKPA